MSTAETQVVAPERNDAQTEIPVEAPVVADVPPDPSPESDKPQPRETDALVCPECAKENVVTKFATPQGLAAHRRRIHNVEGSSPRQVARKQQSSAQPPKGGLVLTCPECEAQGIKRNFSSAQGLSHHRNRTHGIPPSEHAAEQRRERQEARSKEGTFPCPECAKVGVTNLFKTAKGLGSHRNRVHGVAGTSASAKRVQQRRGAVQTPPPGTPPRITAPQRAASPVRQARRGATATLVPPAGLSSEREFAAFRLGVLNMMLHAIDTGVIEAPPPMFLDMFRAEAEEREAQLAGES